MTLRLSPAALAVWLLALLPGAAAGQFSLGGHLAWTDYQDGGMGGGARVGLDIPVLPVDVVGTGEWFSPKCRPNRDGCSLWGATLDANVRLPFPLVRPYVTGGLSYRKADLGGDRGDESDSGLNLGVGVDVSLGVRAFADWRWEFLKADLEGWIARLGLNFNL